VKRVLAPSESGGLRKCRIEEALRTLESIIEHARERMCELESQLSHK